MDLVQRYQILESTVQMLGTPETRCRASQLGSAGKVNLYMVLLRVS